ncbi:MAG: tetratricopeptide repeat protein [Sphingobium sp.]
MNRGAVMKDRAVLRIAASSLIIACTMAGCSGAGLAERVAASSDRMARMADAQAQDAEKAIGRRDAGRAIEVAEAAVAADPDNAAYRTLLGRAYLLGGRYDSARTAFEDALTLGSADPRTIVNLALARTARGDANGARDLLSTHIGQLSAADYGLAMAMAGDPDEAIRILSQAIHDPAASAKERQNLAYAYALSGHWTEARQIATLDLPPLDAAKRVAGWAQMAQPGAESARVIAMIGVAPRGDDAGLPVRLALGPKADADEVVRMAEATPEPAPDSAALSMIAAANEQDVSQAPMPAPFRQTDVADAGMTVEAALTEAPPAPLLRAKATPVLRTSIPAATPVNAWSPVDPAHGSTWVVQLGAFSTQQAARSSHARYVRGHAALRAFPIVESTITLNGRFFHRVAVAGFGDRAGADRLCASIKGQGGRCFVRQGGAEAAPARWAEALRRGKPQQLAMR